MTTARNTRIGVGGENNDRVHSVRDHIHLDSADHRRTFQLGIKMVLPSRHQQTQSEATSRQQKFSKTLKFLRNLRDSIFDIVAYPTCLVIPYGYLPAHSQLKVYPHFARSLVQPLSHTIPTVDPTICDYGESCNEYPILDKGKRR